MAMEKRTKEELATFVALLKNCRKHDTWNIIAMDAMEEERASTLLRKKMEDTDAVVPSLTRRK